MSEIGAIPEHIILPEDAIIRLQKLAAQATINANVDPSQPTISLTLEHEDVDVLQAVSAQAVSAANFSIASHPEE